MDVCDRSGQRLDQPGRMPWLDRPAGLLEPTGQRRSLAEGAGDIANRANLSGLVHGDEVRMVEPGGGSGLGQESAADLEGDQNVSPRQFQGHVAVHLRVEGPVDHAEAALAQLGLEDESAQWREGPTTTGFAPPFLAGRRTTQHLVEQAGQVTQLFLTPPSIWVVRRLAALGQGVAAAHRLVQVGQPV